MEVNRLAIYFFYDNDGIVDDYVPEVLRDLKRNATELCVVVNGELNALGHKKLEESADRILIRENKGFDSWAYKHAIESYGYEEIKSYDELLLSNFTFYAPIYPLKEAFDEMSSRSCDLWGLHRHVEALDVKLAGCPVVEHIQSYFIVFKNNILRSGDFKGYWETLKPVTSYEEAVAFHELRCSNYFEGLGFTSDTYVPFDKYKEKLSGLPYLYYTMQQVLEDRCPIIKRKVFAIRGNWFEFQLDHGPMAQFELLDHINKEKLYDINLIIENIKRCYAMLEINASMPPKSAIQRWKVLSKIHPLRRKRSHYRTKFSRVSNAQLYYKYIGLFANETSNK